jgi:GTP-dependent phosphoenolpyruvate carboxykinase
MQTSAPPGADRPIGELLHEFGDELATLLRAEIALAKAEMSEKSKPVVASAGMFGATAVLSCGAFAAATAAIVAAIALSVPLWVAALIVAAVYGVAAAILAAAGKTTLQRVTPLVPQQTAQTIKEDIAWAKTRVNSAAK